MTKDYKRNKRPFSFFLFLLVSFVTQQIRRQHTHAVGGVAAHLFYFFFVVVVLFILKKKNVGTTVGASSSDIPQLPSWDKNPSYPFRHSSLYMFVFIQPKDEKMILILSWLLFLFPLCFVDSAQTERKKWEKSTCRAISLDKEWKKRGGIRACVYRETSQLVQTNSWWNGLGGHPPPSCKSLNSVSQSLSSQHNRVNDNNKTVKITTTASTQHDVIRQQFYLFK